MQDRIRRKLFLSVKIMTSDNSGSSGNTSMNSNELIDILRKGSSALTSSDDGMNLAQFLKADIAEILEVSRSRENARDAKLKQELKVTEDGDDADAQEKLIRDAEEEEQQLLSGVAQVRCRLFEGKMVHKVRDPSEVNKMIADEWHDMQKRARVDRTVTIGGMAFIVDEPIPEVVCRWTCLFLNSHLIATFPRQLPLRRTPRDPRNLNSSQRTTV